MAKTNNKKVISYLFSSLTVLIIISTVVIVLSAVIGVARQGIPSLFGRTYLVVQTKSMEPEIQVHDLVINKNVSFEKIEVNDIITFKCIDEQSTIFGQPITHRVIEKNEDNTLTTKGDANPVEDLEKVSKENYIGKVVEINHFIGKIANVFTGQSSFVLVIVAILFVGIVAMTQIRNIFLTRRKETWASEKEAMLNEFREQILREELYKQIDMEEKMNKKEEDD
jgi:signal peptidase I